GLRSLDCGLLAGFVPSGRPLLVLATKSDKLNASARRAAAIAIAEQLRDEFGERAEPARVVTFSAASGEGVPEADAVLSEWLARRAGGSAHTRPRGGDSPHGAE